MEVCIHRLSTVVSLWADDETIIGVYIPAFQSAICQVNGEQVRLTGLYQHHGNQNLSPKSGSYVCSFQNDAAEYSEVGEEE